MPADDAVLVTRAGPGTFRVEVRSDGVLTTHEVEVPEGYPGELGLGDAPADDVVRASFAFLLEREPATSILRRFRLDVIARYFPEYPAQISRYLS